MPTYRATYSYKILGQSSPLAATEVNLYVVPVKTQVIVSSFVVANRDPSSAKFRISASVGGSVTSVKDYLYFDINIDGNDTFASTIAVTLASGDVIRVYSDNGNLSFAAFGSEFA